MLAARLWGCKACSNVVSWGGARAGCERVHRWWATKDMGDGRTMMGKPSVLFRKVINTDRGDGEPIAVNAQLYTVLVMDVPNLRAEQEKCVRLCHAPPGKCWCCCCPGGALGSTILDVDSPVNIIDAGRLSGGNPVCMPPDLVPHSRTPLW